MSASMISIANVKKMKSPFSYSKMKQIQLFFKRFKSDNLSNMIVSKDYSHGYYEVDDDTRFDLFDENLNRLLIPNAGFSRLTRLSDRFQRDSEGTITGVKEQRFPEHVPVDPIEMEKFKADPMQHAKRHAGIMRMKTVCLPEILDDNLRLILAENECLHKGFESDCKRLLDILRYRQPPPEDREMTDQFKTILDKVIDRELQTRELTLSSMTQDEVDSFSKDVDKIAKKIFLKTHYNWKPLNFSGHGSLVYTASRLCPNYAVMLQVLQEIKRDNPGYVPDFVLNHGSGTGSAIWAAHTVWEDRVQEYICLDKSKDMNRLAQKLMLNRLPNGKISDWSKFKDVADNNFKAAHTVWEDRVQEYICLDKSKDMNRLAQKLMLKDTDDLISSYIKGVHFRMFTPSTQNEYSLVISGYMLTELGKQQRQELVQNLWKQTGDYLVLVENGSKAGYNLIMEAVETIKEMFQTNPELEGHIIAPCTHDKGCPKLKVMKSPICSFQANYANFSFSRQITKNFYKEYENYMYVILKKGRRQKEVEYPRIVKKVYIQGQKRYDLSLCCPDGDLHNCLVTKHRNNRLLNLCLKKGETGDFLPVMWSKYDPSLHEEELQIKRNRRSRSDSEEHDSDNDMSDS